MEFNSPLYVGQVLEPREDSTFRKSEIVDWHFANGVQIWHVQEIGGDVTHMALADVYQWFKFDA